MSLSREEQAKEAAQTMTKMVNQLGPGHWAEFVDVILNQSHRTLQQNVGKVMIQLIKGWAEKYEAGEYDERNAKICFLSHMIDVTMSEDDPDWDYLPTI